MNNLDVRTKSVRRSASIEQDTVAGDAIVKIVARENGFQAAPPENREVAKPSIASIAVKRIFDVIGAISIALLFAPVILVIAIIIRLGGQPVVFSHQRVGNDRKMFKCYKFRSMVPDAEDILKTMLQSDPEILREWRESHKLRNDPRITKFGEFIRRSSLDEMPQLWNVLKGDMSLVGPRPVVEDELERYGNRAKIYLSVKPGMTGLWQVMGRSNVTYSRRVALDTLYVRKQSVFLDIWIMVRTAVVVCRRIGAH